jgi:uncharacterized phage protein (TIGR02218 family)
MCDIGCEDSCVGESLERLKLDNDISMGKLMLRRGVLGEISVSKGKFTAEIQGNAAKVQAGKSRVVQSQCDAILGDSRCKYPVAIQTGTITNTPDTKTIVDTSRTEATDFFKGGYVTFTSGDCKDLSMEVFAYDGTTKTITLFLPMPRPFVVGDTYQIRQGCNRTFATCKNSFNNVINFRGFNLVGEDAIMSGD